MLAVCATTTVRAETTVPAATTGAGTAERRPVLVGRLGTPAGRPAAGVVTTVGRTPPERASVGTAARTAVSLAPVVRVVTTVAVRDRVAMTVAVRDRVAMTVAVRRAVAHVVLVAPVVTTVGRGVRARASVAALAPTSAVAVDGRATSAVREPSVRAAPARRSAVSVVLAATTVDRVVTSVDPADRGVRVGPVRTEGRDATRRVPRTAAAPVRAGRRRTDGGTTRPARAGTRVRRRTCASPRRRCRTTSRSATSTVPFVDASGR
ncbi:hypothetical protein CBZ_11590 [Cellulomonas biazotea]|uniref:Uncharacterized protein n=1 Tax=Cellulomonas biazotea TaxID=1709 RepID=A0A402DPP5_9CELL|nr:hypothetical protein CBZ_11590 [Cellulomonas biazotea]